MTNHHILYNNVSVTPMMALSIWSPLGKGLPCALAQ